MRMPEVSRRTYYLANAALAAYGSVAIVAYGKYIKSASPNTKPVPVAMDGRYLEVANLSLSSPPLPPGPSEVNPQTLVTPQEFAARTGDGALVYARVFEHNDIHQRGDVEVIDMHRHSHGINEELKVKMKAVKTLGHEAMAIPRTTDSITGWRYSESLRQGDRFQIARQPDGGWAVTMTPYYKASNGSRIYGKPTTGGQVTSNLDAIFKDFVTPTHRA